MPAATVKPTETSVRWPVPASLALAPLVLGIVVTLNQDHSVEFGFWVLLVLAVVTEAASWVAVRALRVTGAVRRLALVKAVIAALGAAAAIAGLVSVAADASVGAGPLAWAIGGVMLALGVADLVVGIRVRRVDRFGRDWIALGVLELLTAVAVLAVPADYDYRYTVTDKTLPPAHLVLDAAVMDVGLFGVGLIVIGVYLAIAAVSLVSGRKKEQVAA